MYIQFFFFNVDAYPCAELFIDYFEMNAVYINNHKYVTYIYIYVCMCVRASTSRSICVRVYLYKYVCMYAFKNNNNK